MPAPEEIPGSSGSNVPSDAGPVESVVETLPAYTYATDPPAGTGNKAAVEALVDDAFKVADGIEDKLMLSVARPLVESEGVAENIKAMTVGRVNDVADRADSVAQKILKRTLKAAREHLGQAYYYALNMGFQYPSDEQVIYGIETGDYLGSMWLDPNAPPTGTKPDDAPPAPPTPPSSSPSPPSPYEVRYAPEPSPGPMAPPYMPGDAPIVPAPDLGPGWYRTTTGSALQDNDGTLERIYSAAKVVADHQRALGVPQVPTIPPSVLQPQGGYYGPSTASNPLGTSDTPTMPPRPAAPGDYSAYDGTEQSPYSPSAYDPANPDPFVGSIPQYSDNLRPSPELRRGFLGDIPTLHGEVCPDVPRAVADFLSQPSNLGAAIDALAAVDPAAYQSLPPLVRQIGVVLMGREGSLLGSFLKSLVNWYEALVAKSISGFGCNVPGLATIYIYQFLIGFVRQYGGTGIPSAEQSLIYMANYLCQYLYPTVEQAHSAYISGAIDEREWECWVKINGQHVEAQRRLMYAARTRPNAEQITALYRRKKITQRDYALGIREAGVLTEQDATLLDLLQDAQPGLDDVIRFLVRDVADINLVTKFGMDDDFIKKWQGRLVEYAEALGVKPELAQYYWRAHWQLPSPTALMEMLHRLRPGEVPENQSVKPEDVEAALKQQDILPYWVPRLMAISYRPMTRTDAWRAFSIRAITEQELTKKLRDEGYNAEDAALLLRFYKRLRSVQERKKVGLPTPRSLINRYVRDEITERELEAELAHLNFDERAINTAVDWAKDERRFQRRRRNIAAIKRDYVRGFLDDNAVYAQLIAIGCDSDMATNFGVEWRGARLRKPKEATAERLCKWRELNLITPQQQTMYLIRAGWSDIDAKRIVGQCEGEMTRREMQELRKVAKEEERQRKEREKAEAKARKERDRKTY